MGNRQFDLDTKHNVLHCMVYDASNVVHAEFLVFSKSRLARPVRRLAVDFGPRNQDHRRTEEDLLDRRASDEQSCQGHFVFH